MAAIQDFPIRETFIGGDDIDEFEAVVDEAFGDIVMDNEHKEAKIRESVETVDKTVRKYSVEINADLHEKTTLTKTTYVEIVNVTPTRGGGMIVEKTEQNVGNGDVTSYKGRRNYISQTSVTIADNHNSSEKVYQELEAKKAALTVEGTYINVEDQSKSPDSMALNVGVVNEAVEKDKQDEVNNNFDEADTKINNTGQITQDILETFAETAENNNQIDTAMSSRKGVKESEILVNNTDKGDASDSEEDEEIFVTSTVKKKRRRSAKVRLSFENGVETDLSPKSPDVVMATTEDKTTTCEHTGQAVMKIGMETEYTCEDRKLQEFSNATKHFGAEDADRPSDNLTKTNEDKKKQVMAKVYNGEKHKIESAEIIVRTSEDKKINFEQTVMVGMERAYNIEERKLHKSSIATKGLGAEDSDRASKDLTKAHEDKKEKDKAEVYFDKKHTTESAEVIVKTNEDMTTNFDQTGQTVMVIEMETEDSEERKLQEFSIATKGFDAEDGDRASEDLANVDKNKKDQCKAKAFIDEKHTGETTEAIMTTNEDKTTTYEHTQQAVVTVGMETEYTCEERKRDFSIATKSVGARDANLVSNDQTIADEDKKVRDEKYITDSTEVIMKTLEDKEVLIKQSDKRSGYGVEKSEETSGMKKKDEIKKVQEVSITTKTLATEEETQKSEKISEKEKKKLDKAKAKADKKAEKKKTKSPKSSEKAKLKSSKIKETAEESMIQSPKHTSKDLSKASKKLDFRTTSTSSESSMAATEATATTSMTSTETTNMQKSETSGPPAKRPERLAVRPFYRSLSGLTVREVMAFSPTRRGNSLKSISSSNVSTSGSSTSKGDNSVDDYNNNTQKILNKAMSIYNGLERTSLSSDMSMGVGLCCRCGEGFGTHQQIVNSNGEVWHPQCFVCAQCFQPFPEGIFYEYEGRKYCEHDFHVLFAPCCGKCGEFIVGRVIKALNNSWHPDCFRCQICAGPLADSGFVKNAGRALCRECNAREKARGMGKYVCHKCHSIIEEGHIKYKGEAFHPYHFNCNSCSIELNADAREVNGELYCLRCHDKMGIPICGACRRPIEERVVHALGKAWHVEHFVCAKCEKPFFGTRHYEKKGLAYCEIHYHQLFGNICFTCNSVISGDVFHAFNKAWHVNHFGCSICERKMSQKTKFFEFDLKPVCKFCYEKFPSELKRRLKKQYEEQSKK